ncbi:MAG TPA: hypothetical protein VJV74_16010, partial [Terriglobia bacterium]|nr:hypothetical protein [Terriglobia bacterium]
MKMRRASSVGIGVGLILALWPSADARAQAASPLQARGYTALPSPQQMKLGDRDFRLDQTWRLQLDAGVPADDVA